VSDKKDKDKKAKGDKKDKKAKKAAPDGAMSVAAHPRAAAQVRMAKGWGGLAAFLVTAYLSYAHGIAPAIAGERALIAGVAGYLVAWACVVMVWRQLMVAELRARVERARAALEPPPADGAAKSADAKPASDSA
jgi:hypothetical protein